MAADSFADCVYNVVLDAVSVLGVNGVGVVVGVTIDDEELVGTVVKVGTIAIELVDAV